MHKKKFKPVITRVKLNPEQAVLACECYSGGWNYDDFSPFFTSETACQFGGKSTTVTNLISGDASQS